MSNDYKTESIPIGKPGRWTAGALGTLLILTPAAAYLDLRLGILGPKRELTGEFAVYFSVLAVAGGILALSGLVGYWLTWKDMGFLDPSTPDKGAIEAVPAEEVGLAQLETDHGQQASELEPPFDGSFTEVDLSSADQDFVRAAKNYFYDEMRGKLNFEDSILKVFRTSTGRPSWYFLVDTGAEKPEWIVVPHAGRGGAGASKRVTRG